MLLIYPFFAAVLSVFTAGVVVVAAAAALGCNVLTYLMICQRCALVSCDA